MKVTKAEKLRVAVSRKLNNEDKRAVLYKTPNPGQTCGTVKKQLANRVERANKLYGVFFRSDVPETLQYHFEELVTYAAQSTSPNEFRQKASQYRECEKKDKFGKMRKYPIFRCSYAPSGKNMKKVMELYVRERMKDEWQSQAYRTAAIEILLCICNKDFSKQLSRVDARIFADFYNASKACPQPYIGKSTGVLEAAFTSVMKQMSLHAKANASNKIWWLQNQLRTIELNKKIVKISDFKYEYATEDRMRAILVRMRKSLKRGTNGDIAVALLQGIAQMNGKTLSGVLEELSANSETKEQLIKFLKAVHEDYHKTPILKAIRNQDVKVQVHEVDPVSPEGRALDLASINVSKGNERKKYKVALTQTLGNYAKSPKDATQTLKAIKGVLLDYFMWLDSDVKAEFLEDNNLWKIPNRTEEYFDNNFVPIDDKKDDKIEAIEDFASIWRQERVKNSRIKARMNYVNCGKYQQLIKQETDDFRICWISYAKDFVEKNYVSKNRQFTQGDCFSTKMLLECWKEIIRFICGKYIDIGKAVYHFAMPETMNARDSLAYGVLGEKYKEGISSFDYEAIKAEETLQRDIAKAAVAAIHAFSGSVIDDKKPVEDILFIKDEELQEHAKADDVIVKQILRFYGGFSSVEGREKLEGMALAKEVLSQLKAIRNENFHFTQGKRKNVEENIPLTKALWENEEKVYRQTVKETYYSNNVSMFYSQEVIQKLVAELYQNNNVAEAQIPAFRTIWKRKDLPEYIGSLNISWDKTEPKQVIYEGALYFLLKEIYYRDFIKSGEAKKLFFDAVMDNATEMEKSSNADSRNQEKKALANAGKNFRDYVNGLNASTLGEVCQFIQNEYNQQNRGKQEQEIYKHFKMLLPICMRKAFQRYIDEKHSFIKKPGELPQTTEDYLENVKVACPEKKIKLGRWFTFAHFIHPRELNFLIGDFKNYIQYREDVLRRSEHAGQFSDTTERDGEKAVVDHAVQKAKDILGVLEFVRHISGRVSNEFTDYYADRAEYDEYMAKYFEPDVQIEQYDLYGDAKNAKVIRNIELARMYAGDSLMSASYRKITKKEIETYYAKKDEIAQLQSQGICNSKKEQEDIVAFQKLKNRITLNEVTDLWSLVNELLGNLVSLAYLRERDEMYLFLGFYYMALRHPEGWTNEIMNSVSNEKYAVKEGLVLYQTVAVFDFGTKLLFQNDNQKWEETTGYKWQHFIDNHKESYACILPLFEIAKCETEARAVRNYVDHFKYYSNEDRSILELYGKFYTHLFGYSTRLRKSVLQILAQTLEKHGISAGIQFDGTTVKATRCDMKSVEFTYKYEEKLNEQKTVLRTISLPAKSEGFITAVCEMLKQKKGDHTENTLC